MKLGEIANILGSTLGSTDSSEQSPIGYSIDSRTVRAGEMFFAIRGENYDGHRFVQGALERGAIAAVVSRDFGLSNETAAQIDDINLIRVPDTLVALQSLATAAIRNWRGQEVAITGSMGKTTTKEMTAAALAQAGR
ncbi:MAG TPA: Mur ligase domain-containing protein, partial [Blastocatellia bacterium]|nr:Mur ligase domain-containing protein [Blastocatellia bacterium]